MKDLLSKISNPSDLKKIKKSELTKLAEELRQFIIDIVSENGSQALRQLI